MVHIRGQVSAKGAGNYHDLSMLERPPDEEAGAPSEAVPDDSLEPNMGAAGVGEAPLDEGDERPHVELPMETEESQELRSPRQAPETTAGDGSPAKRARKPAEVVRVVLPSHLELSVRMRVESDRWLVQHGRSKLVRVAVVEHKGVYCPLESELPVRPEDVKDVCYLFGHDRSGNRVFKEYNWRKPEEHGLLVRGGFWTGAVEFELKDGWQLRQREPEDCHEVNIKKGRKELNDREVPKERREGLSKAKVKEWTYLVDSGAIKVHTGVKAQQIKESLERGRLLKSRFVITEAEAGSNPMTQDSGFEGALVCPWLRGSGFVAA
eukprot:s1503_g13.t1